MTCRAVSCAADITLGICASAVNVLSSTAERRRVRKRTRLANTVKGFSLGRASAI